MRWVVILGILGLVSCGSDDAIRIKQYHLRSLDEGAGGVAPLEAEQKKRLYGAVSLKDQEGRLGHYYTVRFEGPAGLESEPVRLVFEYQQAATASAVRRMEANLEPLARGAVEFQVIGENYREGGRVLAWRLTYYRGGELIETHRSYLWE